MRNRLVNQFTCGASVGPFIFLIQGEILAALAALSAGMVEPGVHEVDPGDHEIIASAWLRCFNDD